MYKRKHLILETCTSALVANTEELLCFISFIPVFFTFNFLLFSSLPSLKCFLLKDYSEVKVTQSSLRLLNLVIGMKNEVGFARIIFLIRNIMSSKIYLRYKSSLWRIWPVFITTLRFYACFSFLSYLISYCILLYFFRMHDLTSSCMTLWTWLYQKGFRLLELCHRCDN